MGYTIVKTGKSLTESVYLSLRDDILTYRLKPATKLNIASIAKDRGVSLSAVREALARLSSDGFVVTEPQRGFRVASVSLADLLDLTERRVAIEGQCLLRSIQNGDLAWEGRVLASLHELSRTRVYLENEFNPAWINTHVRFHATLVEACDSPWLMRIRELLFIHSERYRVLSIHLDRPHLDSEHHDIAEAAIKRDTERAVALLTDHVKLTAQIIMENEAAEHASPFLAPPSQSA
ncbi:GntR family transcriptional regulator [Pusillimonas sp. MFBS29]|uniref:GntR family transcriptional regulator n=1 Tax=Pusillimonas sp. MFBS29 TaxID=2886690 RepID=UPI001D11D937|nr:GntR family transcriptional regulator [Pusillimonas sp. MFBS29]MCC2595029.1 GntR family transcriptional regulator [Pusillimonas sp. MFBS29]